MKGPPLPTVLLPRPQRIHTAAPLSRDSDIVTPILGPRFPSHSLASCWAHSWVGVERRGASREHGMGGTVGAL